MTQKDNYYVKIGSTMCLRTTLRKYNVGWYASGTDIAMHLRLFILITHIFGSKRDRQMVEYTIYQQVGHEHHNILQWARNTQIVICYENELKLFYLLREEHISLTNDVLYQYQICAEMLAVLKNNWISQMLNQITITNIMLRWINPVFILEFLIYHYH